MIKFSKSLMARISDINEMIEIANKNDMSVNLDSTCTWPQIAYVQPFTFNKKSISFSYRMYMEPKQKTEVFHDLEDLQFTLKEVRKSLKSSLRYL